MVEYVCSIRKLFWDLFYFFPPLKKNSEKYFSSGKITIFSSNEKKIPVANFVFPSGVDARSFFSPTNYNNIFTEALIPV